MPKPWATDAVGPALERGGGLWACLCMCMLACSSAETPARTVPGDLAHVQLLGPWHRADGGPVAAWSHAGLAARFEGTAIAVHLEHMGEIDAPQAYFNVYLDRRPVQRLRVQPGRTRYLLGQGLRPGAHSLRLVKRSEALTGPTRLLGLSLSAQGRLLPPPEAPAQRRHLWVVGDSISAGYGNEGAGPACHFDPADENAELTYGARAARALGAKLTLTAWSGRGLWRNRDGSHIGLLGDLWPWILPETPAAGRIGGPPPDAFIINLGTNDLSRGLPPSAAYATSMHTLLAQLHGFAPAAQIWIALSPMLSDAHPAGANHRSWMQAQLQKILADAQAAGIQGLHLLAFSEQTGALGYGCDYHPSLQTHAAMERQLIESLQPALGWKTAP